MNDVLFEMDLEDESVVPEDCATAVIYEELSEETVVPRKGNFLGLDISQNSSGVCLYKDGIKSVYNCSLNYDERNPHAEADLRRQLKDDLLSIIDDTKLDLVVIEDVFEGNNPEVARKLYALNTAIDDLILDGKVFCKEFVRVQNGTWKSWLSVVDTEGKYKGFKDKEKIQGYLELLGVSDEGKGFQDRLDATGMLIGYFLKGSDEPKEKEKKIKVSFKDVICDYEEDDDLVLMNALYTSDVDEREHRYIDDKKITKRKILDYLSSNICTVFITKNPIRLGFLADELDLPVLNNGGYFGFWLSDKSVKKYKSRQKG